MGKPRIKANTRDLDMLSRHYQKQRYKDIGLLYGMSHQAVAGRVHRLRKQFDLARYIAAAPVALEQITPRPERVVLNGVVYLGGGGVPLDDLTKEITFIYRSPVPTSDGDSESQSYAPPTR